MSNAKNIAMALAAGRVALGAGLAMAPARVGRSWIGEIAGGPTGQLAVRATGVRDIAVGAGALLAIRRGAPARGWLEAGMLADAGDIVGTLAAFRHLPPLGRVVTIALAAGAIVVAGSIAGSVDPPA